MDWIGIRKKASEAFRKYKFGLVILLLGLVLMWIPEPEQEPSEEPTVSTQSEQKDPAVQLEEILGQIDGVGKVRVMLTEATGAQTIYQTDEDQSTSEGSDSRRGDTVIITDENRAQSGLVRQVNPPSYLGAIVVCQGADRASVRLAVVEAVSDATGLGADRISVLKMK